MWFYQVAKAEYTGDSRNRQASTLKDTISAIVSMHDHLRLVYCTRVTTGFGERRVAVLGRRIRAAFRHGAAALCTV